MDSTGDGKFCPVASIISPELSRPQNMTMKLSENYAPVIYSIEHIFYCPPHHIAMETHKGIAREFDPTDPNRKNKRKEKATHMQPRYSITCAEPEIVPSSRS